MKRVMLDTKWNEARNELLNYRKMIEKKLPEGWKMHTLMFRVQYQKVVKFGKNRYMDYLRSRWGYPFSIAIHELGKQGKWRKCAFDHRSVDAAKNNPPLKSIKIIERRFTEMKRKETSNLEARI